jgi:putative tricarboxylic transport membrane protein
VPFSGGGESLAAIMGRPGDRGILRLRRYEGQIAGRLRAIGVSSPNRLPGVNVPTFKEQGIDLVLTNWRSVVGAPGLTPDQRIALDQLMERTVKSKAWQQQLKQKGWDNAFLPSNAFATFLKEEIVRVGACSNRSDW